MKPIEKINYRGYTINIYSDPDAQNPRTEWDNLATMVCWHRRYTLGDEQPDISGGEYLCNLAGIDPESEPDRETLIAKLNEKVVILPLYVYEHSGITISTGAFGDVWDSGQVGFIYITREKAQNELGEKTDDEIREYLQGEVETYDQYLTGEVYGREIVDAQGDEIDTVWGFFGYDHEKSGLLPDARGTIDHTIAVRNKRHYERLKKWIKNKVPHMYRKPLLAF